MQMRAEVRGASQDRGVLMGEDGEAGAGGQLTVATVLFDGGG